ncbi:manganese/iron ABC transporter ATP-binding protein [Salinicola endophyticus]|uniref:manganese/iron ABC transporter ATP-binding protein n=1 Tax=Salinicola endophyticus TaxID=1949083 RepID=UPI000DA225CB|nr:manganese/iron ABC transporter ATP-binding protein [Salinicola endophyticus]
MTSADTRASQVAEARPSQVAAPRPSQVADTRPPGGGLAVRGATVTYRNGHTALRDASFEIPNGTITALVGVNGSGKSTLFKAIMGFVKLARGEIRVLDMSVDSALKRNLIAYVPQSEEVDWQFPVLVEDVVMMGRYGHMGMLRIPKRQDREAVETALDRVDMREFRQRQIGELSGGQRKRVFLARALAQDSRVILLDEPFTGVDVKTEDQIIALLRELRDEGRVILVSTHNLGSVPEFCDRSVLIKGTVLAHGPTPETFTQENLERAFGGVLRHFMLEQSADDGASRHPVGVFTDDERALVLHNGIAARQRQSPERRQTPEERQS